MLPKGTISFSLLFLLALLSSCKKELNESLPIQNNSTANHSVVSRSANILFEETFEGSTLFSTALGIENCGLDYALQYVTYPVFQGSKAVRFEIKKDQPLVGSAQKVRSEAAIFKGAGNTRFTKEMWYSYALYFPSVGMEYDAEKECITQWYEDGSDETSVRSEKDRAYIEVCPEAGSSILKKYDLFRTDEITGVAFLTGSPTSFVAIPKDSWHQFTFHIIHSTGSDGLIEVWRDGVKIHTILGRNMHLQYPKWKLGLYKASFLSKSSLRDNRVLYFDNIKVGNADATLSEMTSFNTSPETSPNSVVSYTLLNAGTDKDVATITDGATYNLKALGISKVNIRANTSETAVGSVNFALSGTKTYNFTDYHAPYALFSDDGRGNYYHDNFFLSTPGNYTLTSIPYSTVSTGSTPGTSYSISFTIAN